MRLRTIKTQQERLDHSPYLEKDPTSFRGKWQEHFAKEGPIVLEIGMGKGKYLLEHALNYPDIHFIGVEKYDKVLARALAKFPEGLTNLVVLRYDAASLDDVFDHEVDEIHLTFSDPWPKKRQEKRRLTSPSFLKRYDALLTSSGKIRLRTDNEDFFVYSLLTLEHHGYHFETLTLDLHKNEDDSLITTEYEDKFVTLRKRIYQVEVSVVRPDSLK